MAAVRTWCCPQGHRWEQTDSAKISRRDKQARCPMCGAYGSPSQAGGIAATRVEVPQPVPGGSDSTSATLTGANSDQPPDTRPDQTLIGSGDIPAEVPALFTGKGSLGPTLAPPASPFATPHSARAVAGRGRTKLANAPRIPGYEVLGILGRGAMGIVYEALQVGLNRFTALKMILAGEHAGEEDRFRFRTEAEACAHLQHPHIVQIYEVGQADGHLFFSLELVEGGTLEHRIDGKPMPHRQAAEIVVDCARAMDYAHREGILHRDLKSANILLTREGVPKITDFGLAKNLREDSGHTGSGSILGTPSYMAPEQAQGKVKELTPAADIYALGAILYDALTGRPPFCGETLLDTLQQVESDDPVPPTRFQPKIPRDLETICLKCLRKEPLKRYATAGELADDLERFLRGDPIAARPVSWGERAVRWARRRPAVAGLSALLVATMLGGYLFLYSAWTEAEAARTDADAQKTLALKEQKDAERARDTARQAAARALRAEGIARKEKDLADAAGKRAVAGLEAANTNLAQMAFFQYDRNRLDELLSTLEAARGEFEYRLLDRFLKSEAIRLNSHIKRLTALRFQPLADAAPGRFQHIASGSADGTVVLWKLKAAKVDQHLQLTGDGKRNGAPAHDGPVRSIAIDPGGTWLASGGSDGNVRVWNLANLATAPLRLQAHRLPILSLALHGSHLAAGSEDGTLSLWELPGPDHPGAPRPARKLHQFRDHRRPVLCVAFSPDGTRIASGGMDRNLRIWNGETGEEVFALPHDGWVQAVEYAPKGDRLVTVTADGTLATWAADGSRLDQGTLSEIAGEYLKSTSRRSQQVVGSLGFSPDGRRLAVSLGDRSILVLMRRIDDRGWEGKFHFPSRPRLYPTTTFAEGGQKIATVNFDLLAPERKALRVGASLYAGTFPFSGTSLVVGDEQGKIHWWTPDEERKVAERTAHQGTVFAVAARPGHESFATAGEDGKVLLWPNLAGQPGELCVLKSWARVLAMHPGGNLLVVGGSDGTVRLLDLDGGKSTRDLPPHPQGVRSLAWHPGGKMLVVGGNDGRIVARETVTGKEAFATELPGAVTAAAFDSTGKVLAAAGGDRVIRLWDFDRTGFQERKLLRGHGNEVTALLFTPDGKRLLSSSTDGSVRVWDPNLGQELLSLTGHEGGVLGIALDATGQRLASVGSDGTVLLWEAGPSP